MKGFFGKYRGIVANNLDPLTMGRIQAEVPDVLGELVSGWALPCAPFGGRGMGFFALPSVGANVWIEFEQGDPEYPIWSGCWWSDKTEMPPLLLTSPYKKVMVVTQGGHSITLDDSPGVGGITLQTRGGQKIVLSEIGLIQIDNGQGASIELNGPRVSINKGALEVT